MLCLSGFEQYILVGCPWRYHLSGCENCNISVKYRVGFQPCDYKYFLKSALRYQLWPSFSRLIFNENASFLEFEFRLRVHFK